MISFTSIPNIILNLADNFVSRSDTQSQFFPNTRATFEV